jgi:hypothetical protein
MENAGRPSYAEGRMLRDSSETTTTERLGGSRGASCAVSWATRVDLPEDGKPANVTRAIVDQVEESF